MCEACELGKHHRASFNLSLNKSTIPFQLIHTNVWGPSHISSLNGYKWFVTFTDDFSRTTWVYLMKAKSDVYSIFKTFHKMICTQFSTTIKLVRFDQGGEYIYGGLENFFLEHGMIHQTSFTNTPPTKWSCREK